MRRWLAMTGVVVAIGCEGPPAPDGAVCRDLIHRLCLMPTCSSVTGLIPAGVSCETTLQTKSGCSTDEFEFAKTAVTRDRFLTCRQVVLRESPNVEAHPACEDVTEAFNFCPEVPRMLQGLK